MSPKEEMLGDLSCPQRETRGMSRAELEKRILRLYKGGAGILKIGKALGNGSVLMEQPRPFDVGVAEAAFASQ